MNTRCFVLRWVFPGHHEKPVRDGEDQGDEPDQQAADVSEPRSLLGVQLGGVNDGQVAIQNDAKEQKDPTVEVDLGKIKGKLKL